jgi:hypothetical protein
MSGQRLPVPADLANVPQRSLKVKLLKSSSAAHAAVALPSTLELASAVAALLLLWPLQDFLVQYSRVLCDQFAPAVSDAQLRAFVKDVFDEGGQAAPADVVLELKHVCRCALPAAAQPCLMWEACNSSALKYASQHRVATRSAHHLSSRTQLAVAAAQCRPDTPATGQRSCGLVACSCGSQH